MQTLRQNDHPRTGSTKTSRAAFSAKVFAIYLFIIGSVLVIAPDILLSLFQIPTTSEVWIHVVGVVAFMMGVYVWIAARHENRPFLEASVYTRFFVFIAFLVFAIIGLGSPMIVLFGVADLLGGLWMHFALKADDQALKPNLAD